MNLLDKYKVKEIAQYAVDKITEIDESANVRGSDLQHEIYDTYYYIIGTFKAAQWLFDEANEHVFEVIREIQDYEKENFGQIDTDFSNPEKVVHMYTYIIGESVLQKSKTIQAKWDEVLESNDLLEIAEEIKEAFAL